MKIVPFTVADVEALWALVERTPQIFPGEVPSRAVYEASLQVPGAAHWLVKDGPRIVALLSVSNIVEGWWAEFHHTWFDGVLDNERAAVGLQWLLTVMEAFDLQIARGFTPANRKRSLEWICGPVGLHLDGLLRLGALRKDGSYVDMACTSITPAEARVALAKLGGGVAMPAKPRPRKRRRPHTLDRFLRNGLTTRARRR